MVISNFTKNSDVDTLRRWGRGNGVDYASELSFHFLLSGPIREKI